MPSHDRSRSAAFAIAIGAMTLGAALAAATPTRMRPPPDPPWRIRASTGQTLGTAPTADATYAWYSGDLYETLPAAPTYREAEYLPAVAPAAARFQDDPPPRYDEWRDDAWNNDAGATSDAASEPATPPRDTADDAEASAPDEADAASMDDSATSDDEAAPPSA
ncbi:hypothetical protein OLX02_15580 [Novosphingobium sp. KCTC 2891]|uniref:hypothetical protein n=1 Tax=Novosphingobium sp. KCTC 2891 TaxID=2989730 RepID=UPI002221F425|nr:hypothetical protein [Novosphingobium sp. KCTC 2891]MCW1384245.1 hypothetical protein [Novosphingobium sp. KCTC 2891]